MTESLLKLQRVLEFESEISKIRDIDFLLEKILGEARAFTGSDAGSIYIREGEFLKFSYTQNDTLQAQLPPGKKLIYSTFSTPINSRSISGHVAVTGQPLNIDDVWNIPEEAPYSFNKSYDDLVGYHTCSMLTLPLTAHRGDISGVLQLINAKGADGKITPFPESGMPILAHLVNVAAHAVERAKLTRGIILRMNKMAELRDPKETGDHANRVASYSVALYEAWARSRGLEQVEIERNRDLLRLAAMLHDVGKVAISDLILKKPARFTPEEFEIMKQHTVFGAQLFGELYSDIDDVAMEVILNHHERWDGNGYPGHIDILTGHPLEGYLGADGQARGKKGEEIPLFGRIVAIADVYDALSHKRCYKEIWDPEAVIEELQNEAGKMFDPELTEIFLDNIDAVYQISKIYPD